MTGRTDIIERRMVLMVRAMRNEFTWAPVGEFEAQWAAVDPATPLPPIKMVSHPQCRCDACMKAWAKDHENPLTPNPYSHDVCLA